MYLKQRENTDSKLKDYQNRYFHKKLTTFYSFGNQRNLNNLKSYNTGLKGYCHPKDYKE